MIKLSDRLSIGTLFRIFWGKITITWGLTLVETAMFALIPLLIGRSIDGLLGGDWADFINLLIVFAVLLNVATARRVYDTRAYGTMRVELSKALAARSADKEISVVNARVLMGRELVDFLEKEAPETMTALIQVIVSLGVLLAFHSTLALSAGGATLMTLIIYSLFAHRFFRLNAGLNTQSEKQINALATHNFTAIAGHFTGLRKQEVRLSDTESFVYGLIFLVLLSMLAFNLWFAATQSGASPGQIFSIVTYSYEFVQSAVALPMALQALTRLKEITARINSVMAST
ncbi:ABC transporter six-transmembrane domain-containing protein [Kiloniella sp.]|uniref:ABC transporter six-transmembrane domain-containing protein n=1 Tax=Kiloniella sp. TaxID=1938587 RepID=UPI003B01E205